MYKFKASQFYKVNKDGVALRFDYFGEYKTEDEKEVEILKSLTPVYVQLVEEPSKKPVKKVEPVIESIELPEEVEPEVEIKQCIGETRSGKQCRNEALVDSDFCNIHSK